MYITKVPNRNSPPAILLRESYREDGKVKTRTLANLSRLPNHAIEILSRSLKGEKLVSAEDSFEIIEDGSPGHGHVDAVMTAMRRLDFSRLISSRSSRERNLVVAMVAARIINPQSKIATTHCWGNTTLPETLGVSDADEDDLYEAMDWLLERQGYIERKLAARHLEKNGLALYDLTSSYFEGVTCPLAARGHPRDGKKGKLQVNYGLLTDRKGIPVSVSVFKGNTGDPKTLLPQVSKMRDEFGIKEFALVGDRGMITQKQIDLLHDIDGVDWISALRPEAIRKLVDCDAVQMGLFDERNLFELNHPDFPGERLVACRNKEVAQRRVRKRKSLLGATVRELHTVRKMVGRGRLRGEKEISERVNGILEKYKIGKHYKPEFREDGFKCTVDRNAIIAEAKDKSNGNAEKIEKRLERHWRHVKTIDKQLDKVRQMIEKGQLHGKDKIGVRAGKVLNKYKVGKHFNLEIRENDFNFKIDKDKVEKEAALDGIYIVRTSLPKERMDAEETVRGYKLLSQVEQAFRSMKTIDIMVRPIHHRLENRVRAHIFLCMLAYYVKWHMMEAWRPIIYADEELLSKNFRDPVAPAKRSSSAMQKIHTKRLDDGSEVHSFHTILEYLGQIVRATCRCKLAENNSPTFEMITNRNPKQKKAFDLLETIRL